jgi:hypothetical protein
MYHKKLGNFFNNGICDRSSVNILTSLSRSPSGYLQALFKHKPDRRMAVMMLYPDAFSEGNSSTAIEGDEDILHHISCGSITLKRSKYQA